MCEVDFSQFCGKNDPYFGEPFSVQGRMYATDRRIAIRGKSDDYFDPRQKISNHQRSVRNLFEQYDWSGLEPLQKSLPFDTVIFSPCGECGGSGKVEFESDRHSYSIKCKSCEGKGKAFEKRVAIIGGLVFDADYIALIDHPTLKGKIVGDVLLCEFGGNQVVLMRMLTQEGNHGGS